MEQPGPIRVEAYAKVNLGLSVGPLRDDGYHAIETVFQSISLSDTLILEPADGEDTLTSTGTPVTTGPDNLILLAVEALRARADVPPVRVGLTKRIPVAAGLGGGSSDAAAALVGLRTLFALRIGDEELHAVALEIGSDVPFFLTGGTALGRGRGEILRPLPPVPTFSMVLVAPDDAVRASEAYAHVRIGLTDDEGFIRLICSAIRERDLEALAGALRNDLEPGVVLLCPRISATTARLLDLGALGAIMSGSGPAVLGIFEEEETAHAAASRLRERGHTVYVAEPIDVGYSISTP